MNDPLVSIILPTYNSKHEWITLSIESILRQEYKNFELLMVDDASTNGFLEKMQDLIASDPRITLIQNSKNLGLSDSYNTGIKQSHGKYIARMDHDDIWSDSLKLRKQVDFMEENADYALCGTGLVTMNISGETLSGIPIRLTDRDIRSHILKDSQFAHPSVLIRRESLDVVGWYSPEWNCVEDHELWLRIGKSYKFANLPDVCLHYRINPNGVSGTKSFRQKWMGLLLTWKYRNDYPGFYTAMMLKIPYVFLPKKVSQFLLTLIKK